MTTPLAGAPAAPAPSPFAAARPAHANLMLSLAHSAAAEPRLTIRTPA
jgi:hypothetical protein